MTDLSVMMNWFAPDVETREAYCSRCGTHVTADRHATKVLCEPCRREYDIMNNRNQHAKHAGGYASTGDPEVDLVMSLILHAARDAKDGDRDASQFLVAHDGAELWLRSIGIGVTNQMRRTLGLLAIGAE
jgi:DNA-directed RNA polymerase subunit RPC12/RpoP